MFYLTTVFYSLIIIVATYSWIKKLPDTYRILFKGGTVKDGDKEYRGIWAKIHCLFINMVLLVGILLLTKWIFEDNISQFFQ